jgi:uncharacterized membrane protein YqaE (UPF0057 family)
MKTRFISPLIAIILLSSCSNKFSLQKRRYNKGFYFAKMHRNKSNEHSSTEMKSVKVLPESKESPEVEIVTASAAEIQKTSSEELNPPVQAEAKTKTKKNQSSAPIVVFAPKKFRDLIKETAAFSNPATPKASDSDVKLILLVILAIFIPPLAIYLKDQSTNKWFWITLILCLLSFTVFFFVFGGLFWLISIVIALLYVLDLL